MAWLKGMENSELKGTDNGVRIDKMELKEMDNAELQGMDNRDLK